MTPSKQPILNKAYDLESLLRVLGLAIDEEQICGKSLADMGGGPIMEMAADWAGEIVEHLETAGKHNEGAK